VVDYGYGFQVAAQRDVTFGTATGTLSYLAPSGGLPIPPRTLPATPTTSPYSTAHARGAPAPLAAARALPASGTPTPSATVPADSYFALVLMWRVGPVQLRLLAVSDGNWPLDIRVPANAVYGVVRVRPQDQLPSPPDAADSDLLQTAATVQPYTGCGQ
jgi:hypothetical protein